MTLIGLPVAPGAVTWTVPVREEVPVFASQPILTVPLFVPLKPDVMRNQDEPEVTEADQFIVPVPEFDTLNEVVPASAETSRCDGVTDNSGCGKVAETLMYASISFVS